LTAICGYGTVNVRAWALIWLTTYNTIVL